MEWLQRIFDKLLSLLPMTVFIYPYEAGVRVTCLGWYQRITDIESGWYVVWPLIQYILKIDVKMTAIDIRNQSARTKDGIDVIVSGALLYRVYNARKALLEVMDHEKSATTVALGVIRKYISKHNFDELTEMVELTELIRKEIHETCTKWGIKISSVEITDFGKTRNIRLLTNGTENPMEVV